MFDSLGSQNGTGGGGGGVKRSEEGNREKEKFDSLQTNSSSEAAPAELQAAFTTV